MINLPYKIVLGSQSPRRKQLLSGLGITFDTWVSNVNEEYPEHLQAQNIALYLSKKKAEAFSFNNSSTLLITADTIVWINNHALNKPQNYENAKQMLWELSGTMHQVYTGVCLKTKNKEKSFYCETNVYFKPLTESEIDYYLTNYKPYDKAGSYGIQEWIGYTAIWRIEGSYFNIMGLPTAELYNELLHF
jgi:septum formation protein